MKSYSWTWYSEAYCKDIKQVDNTKTGELVLYEAFNNAEWNKMYFIVYKDKVVYESFNYNDDWYKFPTAQIVNGMIKMVIKY
jgi:hypothetical protein